MGLNPVQHHLLELFSKGMTEKELLEIKALLVKYYQQKVDAEMDAIWQKKGYTKDSFNQATENLHLRRKQPPTQ
jgi:hypothetical protein